MVFICMVTIWYGNYLVWYLSGMVTIWLGIHWYGIYLVW